jgi:ribonuclease VapC
MVIDTSAFIAILKAEPEAETYLRAIHSASSAHMSAATYLEVGVVVNSKGDTIARNKVDALLNGLNIAVEPFTFEQAKIAREAHRIFGKGRHPAKLNFGDCFSYALSKTLDQPLLYQGDDFGQTDVASAIS